jgi:hypothetical protein
MIDEAGAAGAAAVIDDEGAGGAGSGAGGGAGAGAGAGAAAGAAAAAAGGGDADPDWLESFSAEGGDADNPSNRDWLKAKGFKTLDDLAKSYREAEHAIRNGGKFTVPGEGAKPEEVAAYHKAIGVPEKVDGYSITLPDGVTEDMLDMPLLNSMREKALAAGTPAKAFDGLVQGVIQQQLDTAQAQATAENESRDALLKEWGGQKDAKMAEVNSACRALGLSRADVVAIQRGFGAQYGEPGSRRTLELLQKLGAGIAEDKLLGGDGPRRFGITPEEAQAEINKLSADREFGNKLMAKDPDAVARWGRLNEAVAAGEERKKRAAAGG